MRDEKEARKVTVTCAEKCARKRKYIRCDCDFLENWLIKVEYIITLFNSLAYYPIIPTGVHSGLCIFSDSLHVSIRFQIFDQITIEPKIQIMDTSTSCCNDWIRVYFLGSILYREYTFLGVFLFGSILYREYTILAVYFIGSIPFREYTVLYREYTLPGEYFIGSISGVYLIGSTLYWEYTLSRVYFNGRIPSREFNLSGIYYIGSILYRECTSSKKSTILYREN